MTTPAPSTIELQASGSPVMNQPQLSVVIPVFNERYTIRELIRRVQAVEISKEIIAVDDGSTDGTHDILLQLQETYTNVRVCRLQRNQGKGAAIRRGIQEASGEFLIIQDADLEVQPRRIFHAACSPVVRRGRRGIRVEIRRRSSPSAPVLAFSGEPAAHAVDERDHESESLRHGDVLQGFQDRVDQERSPSIQSIRLRARGNGKDREARLASV